ncbi:MAG: shikimate dehydrogenase [bacterium]
MSRRAGIIGHPVAHSLSPVFQAAAFAHCGLDVMYERWDTPPGELETRVRGLRDAELLGANVTIPHKESVIPFLDELGGQSARVGAVNTIVNREGRLFGFNTDGPGFVAALRNEAAFNPAGKSILVVGAGGAARGIVFALAEASAAEIAIWNRTPERAQRLAADASGNGSKVRPTDSKECRSYDCIVNCTSVGMDGTGTESSSPVDFGDAADGALAVDIVYKPEKTAFLKAASGHGVKTLGGLPMLIYQGALAFELWTGVPAPVDVMFDAARRHLKGQSL